MTRPRLIERPKPSPWLLAFGYLGFYAIWSVAARLLVLTLLTYLITSSTPHATIQEISEAYASNEIVVVGAGALLFVLLLKWLHPLTTTTASEIFSPRRFERYFVGGFLQGTILAAGIALAFLLTGVYRYLGSYIQMDDAALTIATLLLRAAALLAMAYCEEFIFRYKIMGALKQVAPPWAAALLAALAYCAIKALQFKLGIMHAITLFLLACALAIRTLGDSDFNRGAGFLAGILLVFHPILSLPVFGSDLPGALLIKYESKSETLRLLSGGIGGPLSGFAVQLLLALDIAQSWLRPKKSLSEPLVPELK